MMVREQEAILGALRGPDGAGVLLHGIGGVGKSTLAAQILHQLADEGHLVILVEGETDPDRLLGAIATRLQSIAQGQGDGERDPFRLMAGVLREARTPWRERFEILSKHLFAQVPVVCVLDNFEDNVSDGAPPAELSALIAGWLSAPRRSRVIITCRQPFTLAGDAHDRLTAFHIGPLPWAEAHELMQRLDGLKDLPADEQRRAYESVGGHARALEYLDAFLRGGEARFAAVEERLREHLKARGIADAAGWCDDAGGGPDSDLAEAVMLAAGDTLLDALLDRLTGDPLARRMLLGAAVYRVPVDMLGLVWLVGEAATAAPDADRTARLKALTERLIELRKENPAAGPADLNLSEVEMRQAAEDYKAESAPPVTPPGGFVAAAETLLALSLLAPVRFADEKEERDIVQRWTAAALKKRASGEDLAAANLAAADYWLWRADNRPQPREGRVADWLEARRHLHASGDTRRVHDVTARIVRQLDRWGAREWEERLLAETLTWMPDGSTEAAVTMHQLGMAASRRGDDDAAETFHGKALKAYRALGDREGEAGAYHNLGLLAQERGDLDTAEAHYRQSVEINEATGNDAGRASTYHQLGMAAESRGHHGAALDWYQKSLDSGKRLGNHPAIAQTYHQLGALAQAQGRHADALDWYGKSLDMNERIGHRDGLAGSLGQIGILYTETDRAADAVPMTLRSLAIRLEMRSPDAAIGLFWLSRQRQSLGGHTFRHIVEQHLGAENAAQFFHLLDEYERRRDAPDA